MALSQENADLFLDAASIVAKYRSGKTDLSAYEQETISDAYKLFIFFIGSYPELSGYQDLANYITGGGIEGFLKEITPTILHDVAEIINTTIRKEKVETKEEEDQLLNTLKELAKENEWEDLSLKDKKLFERYANLLNMDSPLRAYLIVQGIVGPPRFKEPPTQKPEEEKEAAQIKPIAAEEEKPEEEEAETPPAEAPPPAVTPQTFESLAPETITKLRNIIYFNKEYVKLTGTQQETLNTVATALGRASGRVLFVELREHPEEIGVILKEEVEIEAVEKPKEEEITAGKVELSLMAANIAAMLDQEELVAGIKQKYKDLSEKDLDRLTRIAVRTAQLRLIAEYAEKANSETIARSQELNKEINPKLDESSLVALQTASREIITTAIADSGITFEKEQIETAVENCVALFVANNQPIVATDPDTVAEIGEISLSGSGNPEYLAKAPTAALYSLFNQAIGENRATLDPNGNLVIPAGQLILNKDLTVALPAPENLRGLAEIETSIQSLGEKFSLPGLDRVENSTARLPNIIDQVTINPNTTLILDQIGRTITKGQVESFVHAVNATPALTDVFIRSLPTTAAHQAQAIAALQPGTPRVDKEAIPLYSMGLTAASLARIYQYAQANPNSPVAKTLAEPANSSLFHSLNHSIATLSNIKNQLGGDLNPNIVKIAGQANYQIHLPFGLGQRYQAFTNRLSGLVPQQFGTYLNIATHPVQFIQNQVGKFLADRLTSRVKGWAVNQVAKRLGTEVAKKLLEQGAKLLIKEGLKKAIEGLLISTGVGALAAPLVEVAFWLGEKVLGAIFNGISNTVNSLSRLLTGEDFKARDALAIPMALAAGVGALLGGLAYATAVAISTATTILIGSIFVGFILYVSVIAMAPIIAGIAQLESGTVASATIGNANLSCANTSNVFVFQRNPTWSRTFCSNCSPAGSCNIGASGCGSASYTMILNAFGTGTNVVDVWNHQHQIGGYAYDVISPPYSACGTDNNNSLNILRGGGLNVYDISLGEITQVLDKCGLVLATGKVLCGQGANRGLKCGHLLVIKGVQGNNLVTMDPDQANGDNYLHTIGQTYAPIRYWAVVR